MFVPLHTKSDYSPGYGTATIEELVRRAAAEGYAALALTDIENLYGQPRFHAAATRHGVRPITGVELRSGYRAGTLGERAGRLVLLAKDRAGYESLCRILTARHASRARMSDDPADILKLEPRGLFYLSDDVSLLRALVQGGVPRDDVRCLLVRPGSTVSHEFKNVADTDMVMLHPEDHSLHTLLVAIRRGQTVFTATGVEPSERSLPSPAAFRALFADVPDALEEAGRVADACRFALGDWPRPPLLTSESEETLEDRLERRSRERFEAGRHEGRWMGPGYRERLERELAVLRNLQLSDYVLAVSEITDHVHALGIRIGGRGSAGGSLVAHVLGITPLDPIAYGLFFERFVHAGRGNLPDIDLDLPSDRRDAVLDWVLHRFGSDRAAMVSTHQTFRRRGAFREGLKALGMSTLDVDRFAERMPPEELEDVLPFPDHLLTGRYRDALPLIERLIGKFQHLSVHPGGVVLASPRMDQVAPLERAPKGVQVTQYDLRGLAAIGLLKIDLLGNRALSAIEHVERITGRLDAPDGDAATLGTLRRADTIGCFQIETPPMRSLLRKIPVSGIRDLMATLAIVRPGPASGEAKATYVRRARGEAAIAPLPSRLEERFRASQGMLLYEEDLMLAIASLTGRTLEEADAFRSALLAAENDAAQMDELRAQFLEESARQGVQNDQALEVWSTLSGFVAYSFNKAHAAGYAHIAWQTAFLKTHQASAFAAAVLNHYGGIYPLRTLAADLSRHQVTILPPHVNASDRMTSVQAGEVRIGLSAIKRMTQTHQSAILKQRPFQSVRELVTRVPLGIRELEALVLCGACDDLSPLPKSAYPIAHEALLERYKMRRDARALDLEPGYPGGPRGALYAALVRVRNELTYLDMHVSDHPMRLLRDEAETAGCITISEAGVLRHGYVRLAGIVATARRLESRSGRLMQFVTFEDETGLLEAVLFPGTFAFLGDPIRAPGPFLVSGRLVDEQGDVHLLLSEVTPFHERPRPRGT